MPGDTPEAAFEAFLAPLQNTLDHLAPGHTFMVRHLDNGLVNVLTPAEGVPLTRKVGLHAVIRVEAVMKDGVHAVSTRKYEYTIYEETRRRPTRFMWHWHPDSPRSPIRYPHMHIPPGTYLSTKHFPTGRVAFEDIALFVIDELGARADNPEAREIIASHRTAHAENRSWH